MCILTIILMFLSDLFIKFIPRISYYLQPYPFLTKIFNWLVLSSKVSRNVYWIS